MSEKKPLILDIVIPFCIVPERYSFRRQVQGTNDEKNSYMHALMREAESWRGELDNYVITAIRLGGGAATVMLPDLLGSLLTKIRSVLPVDPHAEVSFDALPNTVGTPSLSGIGSGHPNRAELMVRSDNDSELKTLNCPFRSQDIHNAVLFFNRFHLNNIGFTVNYGIPGQTPDSWKKTLNLCTGTRPGHITALPVDDIGAAGVVMEQLEAYYDLACEELTAEGYTQYAAGYFCLPGYENLFECSLRNGYDVLGLGAGAVSVMEGYYVRNTDNIRLYTRYAGDFEKITADAAKLGNAELMRRYAAGRLSMERGLEKAELASGFAGCIDGLEKSLTALLEKGLILDERDAFRPTKEGMFRFREIENAIQQAENENTRHR